MATFVVLSIIAYLLGSLSSAIVVCKMFHLPDPRSTGSKNPGATNVLRIAGKSKAAIVLAGDLLKGFIPVIVAHFLFLTPYQIGFVGLLAVLGHVFPVFYQWKGGKGVATALGVYLGLTPLLGPLCFISWLITFKLFRYSSLASLVTVFLAPFYVAFLLPGAVAWMPVAIIGILIIIQHRSNIERLYNGTENKFKSKLS